MSSLPLTKIIRWFSITLAIVLLPAFVWAWTGKVVNVADGDTITVLTDTKDQVRIRLYGIDAPESRQPFGSKSTQFVRDLAALQTVKVDVRHTDRYGRTVAVIFLPDGTNLNEEIVRAGLAWVYTQFCKDHSMCAKWDQLQATAKQSRIGLWHDPDPIPPWEWRRGNRGAFQQPDSAVPSWAQFSGNTSSGVFHTRSCEHFRCKNCTEFFRTRVDAINAGFRPCGRCRP
ncbi:thermonuclease family protein [Desulfonatronum thioautotrophicum]|uniref:thermonuclease family protein n=1 Tax=Desulfonatronum thioautotrophicum TaxID=617001 RepID=UPI0005EB4A07|nr:thermonuclease family protein [Desulfonatronum thioautotrophicum]